MMPFFIIVLILVASVVGEIMFGNLNNQVSGKHGTSNDRLRNRKA